MRQKRLRAFGSKKDFGMSLLWYWLGYVVVTSVGIAHTIFNILVLHMSSMAKGPGLGQGYEATKSWHPLYNIILFTLFGFLYLRKVKEPTFKKAALTGALWSGISIVIDVFGWVIIKHPDHDHLHNDLPRAGRKFPVDEKISGKSKAGNELEFVK